MDNLNLLCQTIRFQRTALQNSLAMISAVQQHGERFLKATLDQSPWMPGEGKDACLFLAGIWRKNLTGVSELVDKNLATMERLTAFGERREKKWKPAEKPVAEPAAKPQPEMTARQATPEEKQAPEKPQPAEKQVSPPKKEAPPKKAEQTAIETRKAAEPPEKKPEQPPGKQQAEKKKPPEPKS